MLGDQLNQLWPPAAFPVIASLGLKCIGAAAETWEKSPSWTMMQSLCIILAFASTTSSSGWVLECFPLFVNHR